MWAECSKRCLQFSSSGSKCETTFAGRSTKGCFQLFKEPSCDYSDSRYLTLLSSRMKRKLRDRNILGKASQHHTFFIVYIIHVLNICTINIYLYVLFYTFWEHSWSKPIPNQFYSGSILLSIGSYMRPARECNEESLKKHPGGYSLAGFSRWHRGTWAAITCFNVVSVCFMISTPILVIINVVIFQNKTRRLICTGICILICICIPQCVSHPKYTAFHVVLFSQPQHVIFVYTHLFWNKTN